MCTPRSPESNADDPMAAYAEASANFAALATYPDGFEEEAGDNDVPVQGIRSISLSQPRSEFSFTKFVSSKIASVERAW